MTLMAAGIGSGLEIQIIHDFGVILGAACLSAIVFQKLRLALIPAYLISGALIGPQAFNLIPWPEGLGVISHMAILLLLFSIGLELHLSSLKGNILQLTLVGLLSCLLSCLIGLGILKLFKLSWPQAAVIAMGLSLSSTSVVLKILFEKRQLKDIKGRFSLAILVIQDLLVLAMLASLPFLAAYGSTEGTVATTVKNGIQPTSLLLNFLSLIALMIMLKYFLPKIFEYTQKLQSLELLIILALAMILGVSLLVKSLGFSLEMGAFISGLFLANSILRYQVGGQVIPLRDLFIAIFFTTLGMKLNFSVLSENIVLILGSSFLLLFSKTVIIGSICWLAGLSFRKAMPIGLILSQAGEFSLILFESAQNLKIITPSTMTLLVAIVILTLIVTPFLLQFANYIEALLPHWRSPIGNRGTDQKTVSSEKATSLDQTEQFVIAGYGPMGEAIADQLSQLCIKPKIIELNALSAAKAKEDGYTVLQGDITNASILEAAGVGQAQNFMITVPDDQAALQACAYARKINPDIFIAIRLQSIRNEPRAEALGANEIIVEEIAVWHQFSNILANHLYKKKL